MPFLERHCQCGQKVSLPSPKCVISALPCLVRELCVPACRQKSAVNIASCLLSCKLDFLSLPWTQTKVIIFLLSSCGTPSRRKMESCPNPAHLLTPTPLQRLQLCYLSHFPYAAFVTSKQPWVYNISAAEITPPSSSPLHFSPSVLWCPFNLPPRFLPQGLNSSPACLYTVC